MDARTISRAHPLYARFPPSPPCACDVCRQYCTRPGWWLVAEARAAMEGGYAGRMMLELAPEGDFGVLSPAFAGNEGFYALQRFSSGVCTFFVDGRCELFASAFQPIECRFCHHDREGLGLGCHREIEKDWATHKGRRLVTQWLAMRGLSLALRLNLYERYGVPV